MKLIKPILEWTCCPPKENDPSNLVTTRLTHARPIYGIQISETLQAFQDRFGLKMADTKNQQPLPYPG